MRKHTKPKASTNTAPTADLFRAAARFKADKAALQAADALRRKYRIPAGTGTVALSPIDSLTPAHPDFISLSIAIGPMAADANVTVADIISMARSGSEWLGSEFGSSQDLRDAACTEIIRLFATGAVLVPSMLMQAVNCAALFVTLTLPIGDLLGRTFDWVNFQDIPSAAGTKTLRIDLGCIKKRTTPLGTPANQR